jgi:hypothetical protein
MQCVQERGSVSEIPYEIRGREPRSTPLKEWVGIIRNNPGIVNRHCPEGIVDGAGKRTHTTVKERACHLLYRALSGRQRA